MSTAGHDHSPGFLALVTEARARVRECTIDELHARARGGAAIHLVDTREDHEWENGRIPGAVHLSKGTIERDIERRIPDRQAPIVLYCGGGFRSVLVADNLQRMGYTDVTSLDVGWRGWVARGLPIDAARMR